MKNAKQFISLSIPIKEHDIAKYLFKDLPPNQQYSLVIDYPLTNGASFKINTGKKGMSLTDLVRRIKKTYCKIYDGPNKYAIWGHRIEDLYLEKIIINHKKRTVMLEMGS